MKVNIVLLHMLISLRRCASGVVKEVKPKVGRKQYFAITLITLIAVSSAAAYLSNQHLVVNNGNVIRQVTKGSLQMTLETKDTAVIGEATRINITIKNIGSENFTYSASNPLAPDSRLNIEKIGGSKSYYTLHYRWIDLFNGIGTVAMIEGRVIKPMEEITEVYYAKFLGLGEYNVTAWFPCFAYPPSPFNLSCSVTVVVTEADDVKISLNQAINISLLKEVEFASLIRSESLSHPIWYLRESGYPYHEVIVDAANGNLTIFPGSLSRSWCILEMLEYQSSDKYMHVIIGAIRVYTTTMVEQLEELGAKNVTVIEFHVLTRDCATALIPCDYGKIMEIAQLSFVYSLEGLTSVSDD
jgi:hypothetical protein